MPPFVQSRLLGGCLLLFLPAGVHAQTFTYEISTVAGTAGTSGSADGTGAAAQFFAPAGIALETAGSVFVADTANATIRRLTSAGVVTTVAGSARQFGAVDGIGSAARFNSLGGIAGFGPPYVADRGNSTIRLVFPPTGAVTTFAGSAMQVGSADGTGSAARFSGPFGIAKDTANNIYVGDTGNHTIRKTTPAGVVTTLAGTAGQSGVVDGTGSAARFFSPRGLAVDTAGNVYVADAGNHSIRKITPTGTVTTFAGSPGQLGSANGTGSAARFLNPQALAVDTGGNLYVTDTGNHLIRKVTAASLVTTLAGTAGESGSADGAGSAARFLRPDGITVDAEIRTIRPGSTEVEALNLYIADTGNHTIRRGVRTFVSGTPPPVFTTSPASQLVASGSTVVFTVAASGAVAYQWQRDGTAIAGATSATLVVPAASAATAGTYTCLAINLGGFTTSNGATLALSATTDVGRLVNLAIRTNAGTGAQTLIVGFAVGGAGTTGNKPLLIRGAGPSLGQFALTGFLADPVATIFQGSTTISANDNWGGDAQVLARANQVGAFGFASTASLDAALATAATPGTYSVHITGKGNATGLALAEIYDASTDGPTSATPRLVNVSARAQVGTGSDVLIAGFFVGGSTSKTILIRAIGPALAAFGVTGVLADPRLQLLAGTTVVSENDNWSGDSRLTALGNNVGAFPLSDPTSRDAILIATLAPGAYTAQVSGVNNATGVALVEVYEIP